MRTYSHLLIACGLQRIVALPTARKAFLIGTVAPDVGILVIAAGYFASYRSLQLGPDSEFLARFDALYASHPLWIASHNLLHAPLMVTALLFAGWALKRLGRSSGETTLSFAWGAALHVIVDVVTHHSDGPLLLFPFDWTTRFASPISYWDPAHFGVAMSVFEHVLDALIFGALFLKRSVFNKLRGATHVLHSSRRSRSV